MAYLGKEFTIEKEENYKEFISSMVQDEESLTKILPYKPTLKLEKTGDGYKLTFFTPDYTRELNFKPGVTFDETLEDLKSKSVITVDGDTFVQVQTYDDDYKVTFKREFSANKIKETLTTNKWDGVAYRWYTLKTN